MRLPAGPTKYVLPALLAGGLGYVLWLLLSPGWLALCLALAAWEAWTFFDPYEGDTISETVWAYCSRPLVPFALGGFTSYALLTLVPPTREGVVLGAMLGGLMAHFVFQAQDVYTRKD